jgi:hypothetical protein
VISKPYEYSPNEIRDLENVDVRTALMIEGYALACADIMWKLTGDSPCGKSYDPMVISELTAYSYAFNMKDRGRVHDLRLYKNVGEILEYIMKETLEWIDSAKGE